MMTGKKISWEVRFRTHSLEVARRCLTQLSVSLILVSICFGQQPNILFIAVDDLNNWAGFAGDPNAITPNMDKLASEGVHFSRAYCAYPLCGPSRASVMSGVYFSELNASKTQPDDSEVEEKIEALGSSLLHTYLGDRGYKTMAVGKILHSHIPAGSVDLSGGRKNWDFNENATGDRIRSNWPPDLNPDTASTLTDWGIYVGDNGTGTEADMSDSISAAWAVDRLQETHDKPFMLMVGFLHPHVPWYVPQSYYDQYDPETLVMPAYNPNDWDDIPQAGLDRINDGYPRTEWAIENNQWTNIVHSYLANITYADAKIGLVLDALEASPYSTNTIVVLWSDHGYHMGEKNTFQKHTLWDRSGVAPLIIKAPGMTTNMQCSSVVSLLDIYPTLVDLCGLPGNPMNRGQTLRPLLENPAIPWDHPAFTYKAGIEAIQYDDLRHIEYEDGSQELYDHTNDPDEWTNLVNNVNYTAILESLKNMSPLPPNPASVFTFKNGSAWDDGAGGGGIGANQTLTNSVTGEHVTLTSVDIIGQDGTRASNGVGHRTNVGSNDGLGINSADSDKANNFDSGEGWEFTFDTDAYLQEIDLLDMNAGGTLTISSPGITNIVFDGERNGKQDLGSTVVPANTLVGITFSHTDGLGVDGPRIMSLSVIPVDTNAPAIPPGLAAEPGDSMVALDWYSGEVGLAYSVYRTTISGSYGAALATGLTSSDYVDYSVANGTTYYYAVSAIDSSGNESARSSEVSATPDNGPVELFFDGFEGGFSPIWVSTSFLSSTEYEGEKSAKMNNADYVETGIDTTGHSGIQVTYARKTDGLSAGSSFVSEWYDGTSWNAIESISGSFTSWEVVSRVALPAGAEDNPNFRLRFRVNAGSDFGYVDSIVVEGVPVTLGYGAWAMQQGLIEGVNGAYDDDPDGDGMINLIEYAVGGHSLTNDADIYKPFLASSEQNGTNYLNLIYRRRIDKDGHGLDYRIGSATNLTMALTNSTEEAGASVLDSEFEIVTNRIPTDIEGAQFMQLKIILE